MKTLNSRAHLPKLRVSNLRKEVATERRSPDRHWNAPSFPRADQEIGVPLFCKKLRCALNSLIVMTSLITSSAWAETVDFDDAKVGAPPPGWMATKTGKGEAKWTIEKDDTAPSKPNVLKQSGQATYPVCLKNDTSVKDGFVEVKFKPISGKEDQAGGVVWRAKDSNDYYIARANALEDNVTIYHTVKGKRTEKKRTDMKVAPNEWHTLRVDFSGNHFVVTFDGKKAIEWDDKTFTDAGMVGVWTKADSVTLFDDFAYGEK